MKRLIFIMIGSVAVIAACLLTNHAITAARATAVVPAATHSSAATPAAIPDSEAAAPVVAPIERSHRKTTPPVDPAIPSRAVVAAKPVEAEMAVPEALQTLLSSTTDFETKQAVWDRLRAGGRLGEVIAGLERAVADDPQSADKAAALGEAYYKQAGGTQDVRERALAAMKGDAMLDEALKNDPSNWEARYTKAVGMSYWPAELNRGQEVVDQFQRLIQQQETQPVQPQFARSYVRLGDQYQKLGHYQEAEQAWQQGLTAFPDNNDLKKRLASLPWKH
jgi:tetratricopeptide (TPR) repeat protein